MLDFGALPPEINSGRMYAGPGPGSMLAAIGGWQALGEEINATAASFGSIAANLTSGAWTGPSAVSMAAAATGYVNWLGATGAQVEQTVAQMSSAVSGYETAFAATVPPPVIAANRSLYAMLVATNLFGQNTPAIAAAEAHYLEMWAQDAAAMYAYAAVSAAATQLATFVSPPQSSNPGTNTQTAGSAAGEAQNILGSLQQLTTSVPQTLQNMASPNGLLETLGLSGSTDATTGTPSLSSLSGLSSLMMPLRMATMPMSMLMRMMMMGGVNGAAKTATAVTAAGNGMANVASSAGIGSGSTGLVGVIGGGPAAASAGLGRAASIGVLSVPPGWGPGTTGLTATPATLAGSVTPITAGSGSTHLTVPPMLPITGAGGRGGAVAADAQYISRPTVLPRSPIGG